MIHRIELEEVAERLGLNINEYGEPVKRVNAIRRARRTLIAAGVARQHRQRGRVFTTLADLRGSPLAYLWADVVADEVDDG